MNIYTNTPYTYIIRWSKTGMNYYGVRYAKDCHPSELFVTYFTSSKRVANYIKEHGLPDIIQIRKTFVCEERVAKARNFEHRALRRLKAVTRTDFLNKTDNISFDMTDGEAAIRRKQTFAVTKSMPDVKQKRSSSAKKLWEDPIWAAHQLQKLKEMSASHLIKEKRLNTESKSETKNKRRGSQKIAQNRSETKKKQSLSHTGNKHGMYDHTVYTFEHLDGSIVSMTRFEFRKKYNAGDPSMSRLIGGTQKTVLGWKLKLKENK